MTKFSTLIEKKSNDINKGYTSKIETFDSKIEDQKKDAMNGIKKQRSNSVNANDEWVARAALQAKNQEKSGISNI